MGIQIREAKSEEMKKNIRIVQQMTKRMGFDENMDKVNWSFVRLISNFGYQFMPKEKGVTYTKVKLGKTKALVSEYGQADDTNLILYIHGGGFVSGSAASSKGYSSMLAKYSGYKVIAVDYALAPEHAFPKGFEDCYHAFCKIIRQYPKAKITLAGESAGANLCLALALKAKSTKKISCILVHSPIIDFTGSLDRSEHEIDDFTVKEGCLKPLNDIYVKNHKAGHPYISPLFGDYNDFPPTFITCDHNETLYADAKALYKKCEQANVEAELIEVKGTFHAFATIGTGTPETEQILKETIAFIKKHA
ncbi:MAG: alpha/beta hydrolase [Lachnospiraceae bacterium]|nr:alpha/beta hydrolase [Lachnospiraceae bacterium]